jgi:hypothetical protein
MRQTDGFEKHLPVSQCSHQQGSDDHASYHIQPCTQHQDQLILLLHQNPGHISRLKVEYIFPITVIVTIT